ncbi:MAG: hypothetical protein CVU91_06335 [Firmicutes bacterium HGW-Firmicutes-16]|nr:MAG: hypothetical protein CVU91_06335 [Firmicutes bacterium HGW-Firmicutes-16]
MKGSKLTSVSVVAVLFLYLLFIGSAAVSLFLGTKAQGSLEVLSMHSFEARTIPAFIAEKLRESDDIGAIYTGDFSGSSALFIESSLDGVLYTDMIYGYDGRLFELFCEKGALFSREDGAQLALLGTVSFSEPKTGLIHVVITGSDGEKTTLDIFLRSGGEL